MVVVPTHQKMITATVLTMASAIMSPVPETWVDAVEKLESNHRAVYGDHGKAAGSFQFHREAWTDCSKVRREAGLPAYSYALAMNPTVGREYARTWLAFLKATLTQHLGRPAHLGEVWLAYNLGLEGFRRYDYKWHLVPQDKYIKAVRLLMSLPVTLKPMPR